PCQRFERPVRIRHHSNVALRADQDGHLRTRLPVPRSRFGGVQDVAGLLRQMHTFISQSPARILVRQAFNGSDVKFWTSNSTIEPIFSNLEMGSEMHKLQYEPYSEPVPHL